MLTRSAEQERWCKLFGDVGKFVTIFDFLKNGSSIYDAAKAAEVAEGTARAILKGVPQKYGIHQSVYEAKPGPKSRMILTKPGMALHDSLTQLLKRESDAVQGATASSEKHLRLAIPEGPFLSTLLHPLVANPDTSTPSSKPQRITLSHSDLMSELHAQKTKDFDAAVLWYELNQPHSLRHWDIHVFDDHKFELLLVSRTRELRKLVAKIPTSGDRNSDLLEWFVDAEGLSKAGGDIAVPKQFPAVSDWFSSLRLKRKIIQAESVGAVFAKVIAGDASYGVLPDYYEVLDRYRVTDLLHYAKFKHIASFTNEYRIAILTKPGSNDFETLRLRLADRLKSCLTVSHLSRKAEHRELPLRPRDYVGVFHGYFIETVATADGTHEADWNEELLRIGSDQVSAGDETTGGHTVIVTNASAINDSMAEFHLRGGVIGRHVLYLIADHNVNQSANKLKQEWGELETLFTNPTKSQDLTSASGRETPSFVALLPYYQVLSKPNGKIRAWCGFWLGMNSLYHPVANTMIIADHKLDRADRDQLAQQMRIRFMMAGAGFAGQLAETSGDGSVD